MLSFDILREANRKRVAQFKNAQGQPAHAHPDGSDWSFAAWLMATLGELGELANVRIAFESGHTDREQYEHEAGKEFADVQTYFDLLAMRGKDGPPAELNINEPHIFMHLVGTLGVLANDTKKFHRGDFNKGEWQQRRSLAIHRLKAMVKALEQSDGKKSNPPSEVDSQGFDLGEETVAKFNEVSNRVGAPVYIRAKDATSPIGFEYSVESD